MIKESAVTPGFDRSFFQPIRLMPRSATSVTPARRARVLLLGHQDSQHCWIRKVSCLISLQRDRTPVSPLPRSGPSPLPPPNPNTTSWECNVIRRYTLWGGGNGRHLRQDGKFHEHLVTPHHRRVCRSRTQWSDVACCKETCSDVYCPLCLSEAYLCLI